MAAGPHNEIVDLRCAPGELSFEARIGGLSQRVWLRTGSEVMPGPDAALAACLLPSMSVGGSLTMSEAVSPRLLRTQQEYQAIQAAWSRRWGFGDPPLREVDVLAPLRSPGKPRGEGRVAAFFSGGVDSWSTILTNPDITDLVFARGIDLLPGAEHQKALADEVEARLGKAAADLGLPLHVVETNMRELSDPLVRWEAYFICAIIAIALFLEPLFERVLIAGTTDFETQEQIGAAFMVSHLLGTEHLEIVDDGGRHNRVQRTALIADHPIVQRDLRVCWQNPGGAYNCGQCRKCLATKLTLEALGVLDQVKSFPPGLDLEAIAAIDPGQRVSLHVMEDILDLCRRAGRADLETATEPMVARGRRGLDLSPNYRGRATPGPAPSVRVAVVVPVWRQAEYMAAAVQSALEQEIDTGVGVVIVNDGCPDPRTDRIGQTMRDANPDRVSYLRQPNGGLPAARNAGIRHAFARWPHIEAVFPLDADNMLSPGTLAELRSLLTEHPEIAWASPTLEFFGGEEGEWLLPEPFLSYRQLFTNQSDAGSLIRRAVFEAGIEFDETMTDGFEDWEFFLRASLAGFNGTAAGRCGFRYRRRAGSMLAQANADSAPIERGIRERHREAYRPSALARREHAEAPRFALVRCDVGDALLTAACDLEPHPQPLERLLGPRCFESGASPLEAHVPAVAVLTTAATLDLLEEEGLLAETLLRLQVAVRDHTIVGLRIDTRPSRLRRLRSRPDGATPGPAALALRTRTLAGAPDELSLQPGESVDVRVRSRSAPPLLTAALLERTLARMAPANRGENLIPERSQAHFFEAHHVDLRKTTLPWGGPEADEYQVDRSLKAVA